MGALSKSGSQEHLAPEVVPGHDAPEVVPESYPQTLNRQSSLHKPEIDHSANDNKEKYAVYSDDGREKYAVYSDEQNVPTPGYDQSSRPAYVHHDRETGAINFEQIQEKKNGRRYCGLRKATFIIVIVVVALLIVIAVVLGAVLGTVLPNKNSNSAPLQSISMTGLATTTHDNVLYQYFQDPDGQIVENSYDNGDWTLKQSDDASNVVTKNAGIGSPIAAIAYPYKGQNYRQIFYLTSTGEVETINRTETGSWGSSTVITRNKASPDGIGLAACWDDTVLNGIRVYYASQYGYIQEAGKNFTSDVWESYHSFLTSDGKSGVACTIHNGPGSDYVNVYVRDDTYSRVNQWWYDFKNTTLGWNKGPSSWANHSIPRGTDIAACNDGHSTEYVFFQLGSNVITRGVLNPTKTFYETFQNFQGVTSGSKLAAAYYKDGATLVFQNKSSDSTMWASDVARNNVQIFNMAIT